MTKDEFNFIKRKKNLVKHMMAIRFEDKLYDELLTKDFSSMEELDAYFDAKLRQYDKEQDLILDYYDEILSLGENLSEEEEEDE